MQTLVGYLKNWILDADHYTPFKDYLLLEGPGVTHRDNGAGDAGKFASNLLETLWNIAHYTGQWEPIRENWPLLQRFFVTPYECDWRSMGRYAIAELGDEAAPPLAYARLAYQAGDTDAYAFGCYIFGRELVHHYVKQVGAEYFRRHQPYHSSEPIPENVWLTNLWGGVFGWRLGGPNYPARTSAQAQNRWVRFSSFEVARFYRDYLPQEVTAEINALTEQALAEGDPNVRYKLFTDTAHITPSLVRLRAMLLDEDPGELLALAPLDQWRVRRGADVAAMCVPILHNAAPTDRVQVIPPIKTDFAVGLQQLSGSERQAALTMAVTVPHGERLYAPMRGYPALVWQTWRSPLPVRGWTGGRHWAFGQIVPLGVELGGVETDQLNWTTVLWTFSKPPAAAASPGP